MTYYEQLGITPAANAEEIRRAHRRLAKAYHPDAHVEREAKQRAEAQMQRVNAIVKVLSDPQSRRRYDEQLREGRAPTDPTAARILPSERSRLPAWRWWAASIAAAFLFAAALLWFWMNDWGGLFKSRHPTDILPEAQESASPSQAPAMSSTTVSVVPPGGSKQQPHSRQASKPGH
jgi:curved DNA-binding protein CbpA